MRTRATRATRRVGAPVPSGPPGIAIYPDANRGAELPPLPPTGQIRAVRESVAEGGLAFNSGTAKGKTGLRYGAGSETGSVRRRPTTVNPTRAERLREQLLIVRDRGWSRKDLSQRFAVSAYQLHLAELGSVQPHVVDAIAAGLIELGNARPARVVESRPRDPLNAVPRRRRR